MFCATASRIRAKKRNTIWEFESMEEYKKIKRRMNVLAVIYLIFDILYVLYYVHNHQGKKLFN